MVGNKMSGIQLVSVIGPINQFAFSEDEKRILGLNLKIRK